MGAKITGVEALKARMQGSEGRLRDCIRSVMQRELEEGEEALRQRIEVSGTGKVWSRPGRNGRTGSSPGRVDTGEMRDSVKWQMNESKDILTGLLGWLDGDPEWARWQELSFTHHITGDTIEGMRVLDWYKEQLGEKFYEGCRDCLKKVLR